MHNSNQVYYHSIDQSNMSKLCITNSSQNICTLYFT